MCSVRSEEMSLVPVLELDEKLQEWWTKRYQDGSFFKYILDESTLKKFCVFGHGKQVIFPHYYEYKDRVKKIEIRKDDVWIFGFARSGTTLTQEMVWLLDHNLDFETAKKVKLNFRCIYFDGVYCIPRDGLKEIRAKLSEENFDYFDEDQILNRPSPRHFKTHYHFELMPDNLVDVAKVFYLAREVKDVIVSMYHFEKLSNSLYPDTDFKKYCVDFIEDRVSWGPYFAHLKEGWSKRNHPNVMFMFYEDIIKNLPATIHRVSKFLGKDYSNEKLEELYQHLRFDNMKKNKTVNPADINRPEFTNKDSQPFIRQGKSGTWREYFDDELLELTEAWIAKNLAGSDFKYPTSI